MITRRIQMALTAIAVLSQWNTPTAQATSPDWPGFRGAGDSHTQVADLPLTWDDTTNIAWNVEIKGYGQSSPVVFGDHVFVTSIDGPNREKLLLLCFSLKSGELQWQKDAPAGQQAAVTDYISKGAPTPVVDGERVYAFYESGDLLAFSHSGELVWSRMLSQDFGEFQGNHGVGSSPAQSEKAVVILADHSGSAWLAAFSKATGETLWKKEREPRVSWSSPVIVPGEGGREVLISSKGVVQSWRAEDGSLLWEVTGLDGNTVASPSVSKTHVLIGSGQAGHSMLIRRGGQGDVSATHVEWKAQNASSSFGSPVLLDQRAFFVNKAGAAFAVKVQDGTTLWTERLPDSTWASPLAAGDRVYFFCKNGTTVVIKPGDQYEKLAENRLTIEGRLYGYAVADSSLILRTGTRLIRVRPGALASGNSGR